MNSLSRHGPRMAVTLLPLVLAVLHVLGLWRLDVLDRLDDQIYDARLRATMPQTLDERVVIVDIDEASLAKVGHWPWPRHHLANLVDELFERQGIAVLGFDTVFAEPDTSSGLPQLEALAASEWADLPGLAERVAQWRPRLNYDDKLAQSLKGRPVVLGYYFTSDRDGHRAGALPAPVITGESLDGRAIRTTQWNGYGSNIPVLAEAAPRAGFFNAITAPDGVVRAVPLLAEHEGNYYESLALAVFRKLVGDPVVTPGFPGGAANTGNLQPLASVRLENAVSSLSIPVDERASALVPFRGRGGPQGGSFRYIPATDLLQGEVAEGTLRGKIVLLGTTAPGLLDLRVTPVGEAFPGVEAHANLISSLLDGALPVRPDYARGYELAVLVAAGLLLALALPLLSAAQAVALSAGVVATVVGLNFWLYLGHQLVLPLASALVMAGLAFALNMSWGYLVESRAKRELAHLFGTYVPPELVDEMVKDPDRYSMAASARQLTVMFCDMRGFTRLSESMAPADLQVLLNGIFSRLSRIIRQQRGTIDKYMGDCVMAFWGAPVDAPDHATLAVQTALLMADEVQAINRDHTRLGLPAVSLGIGLNTGEMLVGDMGSDVRRSYTVIGDAVNLASRLEGLTRDYGVDIIASASTRAAAQGFAWQELDQVRVKGKVQAVTIHTPLGPQERIVPAQAAELELWNQVLAAWRARDWARCDALLHQLEDQTEEKVLYQRMAERVASIRRQPPDTGWDGTTTFDTK